MTDQVDTENSTQHHDQKAAGRPDVARLEADIERTREDLSHTVDQLAARLDVRSRVRHRVEDVKGETAHQLATVRARATDSDGRPTPAVMGNVGGVVALVSLAGALAWRRRAAAERHWWRS